MPCCCPTGFGFRRRRTRSDWTNEMLAEIRATLSPVFATRSGGTQVNLQGIVFDTNDGGRLPLEKYLAATLVEREALAKRSKTIEAVAKERGLSAKYLRLAVEAC